MFIPKPIRKMLAIFRGSVSPYIIFLSIMLGFWFGLMPGWSGFQTIIIVLMLVINIHIGLFLLSAAIGKALCFAAAPVLYHVGVFAQEYLSGLLNLVASIPIVGITDFSRFSVAGAFVLGPIIGGIAGLLMARSVISFRRALLKFEEGSEKFRKWYSNRWVRILDRLLIGKRTKDAKSLFTSKAKIIRKAGVVIAVLFIAAFAVAGTLMRNDVIKEYAANTMTRANGAEVDLEGLDLSILNAAVTATGIQVTDAENPQNNEVSVEKISANASMYDLLLGRLVMQDVEISDVKFGQKRATPGKLVEAPVEEKPPVFDPCEFAVKVSDISKLENYFKDAKALKERLQQARKWLPKSEEKAAPQPQEVPQEYLEYLQSEAVVPASPRILAKKVVADKVQIPSALFGNSKVQLANVSDSASSAGLPVRLEIQSYDTGSSISVTFDYSSRGEAPKVTGDFKGFDLSKIQSSLSSKAGLAFESGTASGNFEGKVTDEIIDLAVKVTVDNMKAKAQGDGILGLGSQTTTEALDVLKNISTTIRVVGPVTDPRLAFDVTGLKNEFKDALVKAGKERLGNEIDKQIDKQLGEKAPPEIKDTLKKSLDGLGGLIGGKKDDESQ
jgi:uncharacterized protein (TIGR03546 family)